MERLLSWEFRRLCILICKHLHNNSHVYSQRYLPYCTGELEKANTSIVAKISKASEEAATQELSKVLLEPPTNCCMSGCSNCVWITYAEDLAKLCQDGGEQAKKMIEQNVSDPCLKAFLLTELRMKNLS